MEYLVYCDWTIADNMHNYIVRLTNGVNWKVEWNDNKGFNMFNFVSIVIGMVIFFFVASNVFTDSKVLPKLPCKVIESKTSKI
jgi:hypothetical protein